MTPRELVAERIEVRTGSGLVTAGNVTALAPHEPRPAVVVLAGDAELLGTDAVHRLSAAGLVAVLLDPDRDASPGVVAREATAMAESLATEFFVSSSGAAVLGFGRGGAHAVVAASLTRRALQAAVAFHPALTTLVAARRDPAEVVRGLACPLLVHVSTDDPNTPPAQVDAFGLAAPRDLYDVHVYESPVPDIASPSNGTARPAPATLAWRRTLTFLNRHLDGLVTVVDNRDHPLPPAGTPGARDERRPGTHGTSSTPTVGPVGP